LDELRRGWQERYRQVKKKKKNDRIVNFCCTRALLRSAVFKIVLRRYSEHFFRNILFFHISLVLQLAKICAVVFAVFIDETFKNVLWVFQGRYKKYVEEGSLHQCNSVLLQYYRIECRITGRLQ